MFHTIRTHTGGSIQSLIEGHYRGPHTDTGSIRDASAHSLAPTAYERYSQRINNAIELLNYTSLCPSGLTLLSSLLDRLLTRELSLRPFLFPAAVYYLTFSPRANKLKTWSTHLNICGHLSFDTYSCIYIYISSFFSVL